MVCSDVLQTVAIGFALPVVLGDNAIDNCWQEAVLKAVCCEGAWGGSGCWEGGRNFERCCRETAVSGGGLPRLPSTSCTKRLTHAASLLNPMRTVSFIRRIEGRVSHHVKQLNATLEPEKENLLQGIWPFSMQLSEVEREMLYELTATLTKEFDIRKLTYWASGGTLLGMLRHYGPIPWDDDVTLGVLAKDRFQVQAALDAVQEHFHKIYDAPEYREVATPNCKSGCGLYAVYFKRALSFGGNAARFPAVNIHWFDTQAESPAWEKYFGHLPSPRKMLDALLPVVAVRPFGHLRLFQPNDPWAYLDLYLDSFLRKRGQDFYNWCQSRSQHGNSRVNVSLEDVDKVGLPEVSIIPCKSVAGLHPLVTYAGVFKGEPGTKAYLEQFGSVDAGKARSLKTFPGRVTFEVAVDPVRGAHVVLWTEGVTRDQCFVKLYGTWDFIKPHQVAGF